MSSTSTPGYPAPPAPGTTGPAAPPAPAQGGNGFAVAALILGIIGLSVLGLIFGIIGLARAAKVGKGKAMSWIGIVLSVLWLAAQIGVTAYLVGHVAKAADPGCVAAKSLLLDESKMNVSGPGGMTALQGIVDQLNDAASKAKNSDAHNAIKAVADDFQTLIDDVNNGTAPDSEVLNRIEADGNAIDTACGTIGS